MEGLKLFLPPGIFGLTRERLAHLNAGAAKWQRYEFDERHDEVTAVDYTDRGNLATRLVRCPDEAAVLSTSRSELSILAATGVSASDRAMLDVLAITRDHRLAVVELKADEDIHLPLQGLDYWSRVQWPCEFKEFGYFAERELSAEGPLFFLVAPDAAHPSCNRHNLALSRIGYRLDPHRD